MLIATGDLSLLVIYAICLYLTVFWLLVLLDKNKEKKPKPIKEFPIVSVIVPAYNEEKSIAATVESLLNLDYPKDKLDIIVVNDGSIDKTEEIVTKIAKENECVTLINQPNQGKGKSMNHGLKIAKGEFFACLDADSFVEPNALKKILPYFEDKEVGSVLPLLKIKNPRKLVERIQWYEYLINMFYKKLMGNLDCVHVTPGPFATYRTDLIKKLGYFDEHNLTEDLEIALRLQKHHYKIIQIMDTVVYTIPPDSFKGLYQQRNRWYKGSIYNTLKYKHMLFNKRYGDFGIMKMPTIIISGLIAVIVLLKLSYDYFKPLARFFFNLGYIHFDVLTLIKNFSFNFNLLDLNYIRIVILLMILSISVFVLIYSHKFTNEKLVKKGSAFFALITYMLIYSFFLGIVWCTIIFDLMRGKVQKW